MPPVRRTETGFEFTATMMVIIGGIVTVGGFFVTITAAAVGARQQLASATPVVRHDSLVGAVAEIKASTDSMKRNLLGLNCYTANYPSTFCDGVPRIMQAGRPRP